MTKSVFIRFAVLLFVCIIVLPVLAQEAEEIPTPPFENLPGVVEVLLGAVAATIAEFVQKQKSPLASLGIAVGISAVGGVAATLIHGVPFSDLPVFIVQVWTMATATWAVVFKAAGMSKRLRT